MNALISTPARRIALAVALSALVHVLLLWLPQISLPEPAVPQLPPLTAKLIKIPKQTPPAKPKKHTPAQTPKRKSAPASKLPHAIKPARQAKPPMPSSSTAKPSTSPTKTAAEPVAIAGSADAAERPDVPPLPQHAQLVFAAYRGDLYVGDMRHELKIADRHYSIRAVTRTVGLARLFKSYDLTQVSTGRVTQDGNLLPEHFIEKKTDEHGTQIHSSDFDWHTHRASFSNGLSVALPEHSQDFLSFMYQLSQTLLDRGAVPVEISNGKKLEKYHLEVIGEEQIITPMGKQPALHLSKMHAAGEEGLDIWLALKYRLLPIKFRQIQRNGQIAGELVIKEIRVSDE